MTRRGFVFVSLLLAALAAQAQLNAAGAPAAPASNANSVVVIRAGRLIDTASGQVRTNQVIVIRGNKIASVGDAGSTQAPPEAQVIDLSNATVLPGMVESHTHIFLQGEDPKKGGYDVNILMNPVAYRAAKATVAARRLLEQGFTTARDVETEGAGYGDIGIKMAINDGSIPGPRLFVVTRAFDDRRISARRLRA